MINTLKLDVMSRQAAFPEVVDEYTAHYNAILKRLDGIVPMVCAKHDFDRDTRIEDIYDAVLNKMTELLENGPESGPGQFYLKEDEDGNEELCEAISLDDFEMNMFIDSIHGNNRYKGIYHYLISLIKSKASYINKEYDKAWDILNEKNTILNELIEFYENHETRLHNKMVKATAKSKEPYERAKEELIRLLGKYPAEKFKSKKEAIEKIKSNFLEFIEKSNNKKPASSNYEKIIGEWSRKDVNVKNAFKRVLKKKAAISVQSIQTTRVNSERIICLIY